MTPPVIVVRPNDQRTPYEDLCRCYPALFTNGFSPDIHWRVTHLHRIRQMDALLVIGGGELSYEAGVAAAVAGRRVVPVGAFGGAVNRLNNLFQVTRDLWGSHLSTEGELGRLRNPWSPSMVGDVLRVLRISEVRRILIIHGRSTDRFFLKDYLQNRLSTPEPIIMAQHMPIGLTLPEKFGRLAADCHGAIALVTPSDGWTTMSPSLRWSPALARTYGSRLVGSGDVLDTPGFCYWFVKEQAFQAT